MDISVSDTLQHVLAQITKSTSSAMEKQSKKGSIKKQQNSAGEEAVEMAKALFELSTENGGSSTSSMNQDFDNVKTETIKKRENCQFSGTNGNLEQPISLIQVQLPPLKPIPFLPSSSNAAKKIFLNANFSSFAEFKCAFEEWKHNFHHPFRVASSGKLEDKQFAERFKYSYIVYHCSRYGWPRKRGAGRRRPHQNYLPCGCNAVLRLNFHQKNGGSLCVTKLFTEHNHDGPISSEDMLGGTSGMKRSKSSQENEFGEQEHGPNSWAASSSIAAAPKNGPRHFSPLTLQPTAPLHLHHSPSSGGQSSSSEGGAATNNRNFGSELVAPPSRPNQFQFPPYLLGDFQTQQWQQSSTSSSSAAATQQQEQSTTKNVEHGGGTSAATSSSWLLSSALLLNHHLQQIPPTCSSSSTTPHSQTNPSALAFHQQLLQMLLINSSNKQQQSQQQQTPPNHPTTANPPSNAQLLLQQLLLLIVGANNSAAAALLPSQQLKMSSAGFSARVDHLKQQQQQKSTTLLLDGRQEIVQEADLYLQMLVAQMLQCRDLSAYLGRLRQFLAENCD